MAGFSDFSTVNNCEIIANGRVAADLSVTTTCAESVSGLGECATVAAVAFSFGRMNTVSSVLVELKTLPVVCQRISAA